MNGNDHRVEQWEQDAEFHSVEQVISEAVELNGSATCVEHPPEVMQILAYLEAGVSRGAERRGGPRRPFRSRAKLQIEGDEGNDDEGEATHCTALFTRDVSARAISFVARTALRPKSRALVRMSLDGVGREHTFSGTILRCKPIGDGWYEGAVAFSSPLVERIQAERN